MAKRIEPCTIHLCAGPPVCMLEDDEAVEKQRRGCVWCDRIVIDEDVNERREGPGHA